MHIQCIIHTHNSVQMRPHTYTYICTLKQILQIKKYFSARSLFEELVKTFVLYSSLPTFAVAIWMHRQSKSDAVFRVVVGKAAKHFAYTSFFFSFLFLTCAHSHEVITIVFSYLLGFLRCAFSLCFQYANELQRARHKWRKFGNCCGEHSFTVRQVIINGFLLQRLTLLQFTAPSIHIHSYTAICTTNSIGFFGISLARSRLVLLTLRLAFSHCSQRSSFGSLNANSFSHFYALPQAMCLFSLNIWLLSFICTSSGHQ